MALRCDTRDFRTPLSGSCSMLGTGPSCVALRCRRKHGRQLRPPPADCEPSLFRCVAPHTHPQTAALHTLGRTKEAWTTLLRVADRFPDEWTIPYNLARYAAQLGDLVTARDLLAQAFRLGDAKALKLQSMDDPDLAPLWVTLR